MVKTATARFVSYGFVRIEIIFYYEVFSEDTGLLIIIDKPKDNLNSKTRSLMLHSCSF